MSTTFLHLPKRRAELGASFTEYVILLAGILAVVIAGLALITPQIAALVADAADTIANS